jgi:hypothetical protein
VLRVLLLADAAVLFVVGGMAVAFVERPAGLVAAGCA